MESKYYVDYFKDFHPLVNFSYYLSVIAISFITNNIYLQGILFFSAIFYHLYLKGLKSSIKTIRVMLISMVLIIIVNPLVNHQGVTILGYIWDGNPITLESILYGVSAATMLITVIIWFNTYNEIITSDKFIYLFGRIIPKASLIFSMVLRFVPLYKEEIVAIEKAQRTLGKGVKNKKLITKIKHSLNILSIFVTWALESSIETADSMKARGYGLRGRTAFSNFRITKRDYITLAIIGISDLLLIFLFTKGSYKFTYYPMIKLAKLNTISIVGLLATFILCNIPMIINISEEIKWNKRRVINAFE
ncbi:MAG: energy-coupling factor transporter transmembrane protein EcfT [Tissierellia bacterium]|nr:energy-coupling factor transporter transmembrane protein EcfT [Tissierellia bacterium]